jgi:nitroreductase
MPRPLQGTIDTAGIDGRRERKVRLGTMTEFHPIAPVANNRLAEAPVDPEFLDRWSPRAFSSDPVSEETIHSLFEAARWAPSSGNEQPWTYIYSSNPDEHQRLLSLLDASNQRWASHAPVLAFAIARLRRAKSGKPNRHAQFDTGTSWGYLALEARKLGLYAHGMGGFDLEHSYDVLNVPRDKYEVMAAIAIGYCGDPATLVDKDRVREKPNDRKHVTEFAFHGALPAEL